MSRAQRYQRYRVDDVLKTLPQFRAMVAKGCGFEGEHTDNDAVITFLTNELENRELLVLYTLQDASKINILFGDARATKATPHLWQ